MSRALVAYVLLGSATTAQAQLAPLLNGLFRSERFPACLREGAADPNIAKARAACRGTRNGHV